MPVVVGVLGTWYLACPFVDVIVPDPIDRTVIQTIYNHVPNAIALAVPYCCISIRLSTRFSLTVVRAPYTLNVK